MGSKLIKVGKKKNQTTNIQLNLISNNGHNILVGINSIQIYNVSGQIIKIEESHIKSNSNNKLLKLFT